MLHQVFGIEGLTMKSIFIIIGPYPRKDDGYRYWAKAIEDGDRFYYRVNGVTVEISEYEFSNVVINPHLYYFSTALKLHLRIKRAKDGLLPVSKTPS